MRSMHFTWMDLVRLVTRGVSLVIYTFIEIIYHGCFNIKSRAQDRVLSHQYSIRQYHF